MVNCFIVIHRSNRKPWLILISELMADASQSTNQSQHPFVTKSGFQEASWLESHNWVEFNLDDQSLIHWLVWVQLVHCSHQALSAVHSLVIMLREMSWLLRLSGSSRIVPYV